MARRTRSAGIVNSVPGTSCIAIAPLSSFTHSTWQPVRRSTLPSLPSKRLVATAKSRLAPSSWELDVRSLSGQYGQVRGLSSCSGGCGSSSKFMTDFAPWRMEVPMQSLPVSPPPITTTCLPVARSCPCTFSPATTRFCWGRNSIA